MNTNYYKQCLKDSLWIWLQLDYCTAAEAINHSHSHSKATCLDITFMETRPLFDCSEPHIKLKFETITNSSE